MLKFLRVWTTIIQRFHFGLKDVGVKVNLPSVLNAPVFSINTVTGFTDAVLKQVWKSLYKSIKSLLSLLPPARPTGRCIYKMSEWQGIMGGKTNSTWIRISRASWHSQYRLEGLFYSLLLRRDMCVYSVCVCAWVLYWTSFIFWLSELQCWYIPYVILIFI